MLTHVVKPIRVGKIELKNRVVRTAHGTRFGLSDAHIAYHVARARGGAALSILEVGSIHPATSYMLNLYEPATQAWLRRLAEAVRPHGMKLFQQLYHGGHHARPADGSPPWAPSDIPSVEGGIVPITMSKAMIDETVAAYAETARRCEEAGLDGVEIHGANGKLPQQFLSVGTNRREDEYGGSLENRGRFILEVHAAVRAAVSRDFVVGVRLSPDMLVNGVSVDDNRQVALMLERQGLVDYVSLSLGNFTSYAKMLGGMHEPVGYQLETSSPIVRALKVPTIIAGRYRTLEDADGAIRNGDADLVGMVRALIADPDLVVKSLDGRVDQVRPCIGCNQGCVGNVASQASMMRCTVNPVVGAEDSLGGEHAAPARPRRILVVGGGPAGMEAARVAALRGHKVTLAEATARLGGTLHAAAMAPTRAGMLDIAGWLESEIYRLGVDVRLSTPVEEGDVKTFDAEAVIVATGSRPRLDGIQASHPGQPIRNIETAHVISSTDLFLAPPGNIGRNAVVIDDAGHYEGLAAAEHLVAKGLSVTLVTRQRGIAHLLQSAQMIEPFLGRMTGKPFRYKIRARAIAIEEGVMLVGPAHLQTDQDAERIAADTVVFISANRANRDLYDRLCAKGVEARVVGDANSPRYLESAIREGHIAGGGI